MTNKKATFTAKQIVILDQMLRLIEQNAEVTKSATSFLRYGASDKDPDLQSSENPVTKKNQLSRKVGELLSTIDHLVEDKLIDQRILQEAREQKYWANHEKWDV